MAISFFLKFFSCIFFSFGNYLTKRSTITGIQLCCLQSLLSALFLFPFTHSLVWPRAQFWLWVGRFFLGTLASLFWVYSLQKLSLFDVISLQLVSPFVTVLGSVFFLKEKISWTRSWSILFSILGTFLVIFGYVYDRENCSTWGAVRLLPIGASLCCAGVYLLSKKILKKSNVVFVVFQQMVFNGFVLLPSLFFHHRYDFWKSVDVYDIGLLFLLSFCTSMAHLCLHFAIFFTDLVCLMPLGGIRSLLSVFLGVFFLGERPGFMVFCGTIIIIISMGILSCSAKRST